MPEKFETLTHLLIGPSPPVGGALPDIAYRTRFASESRCKSSLLVLDGSVRTVLPVLPAQRPDG